MASPDRKLTASGWKITKIGISGFTLFCGLAGLVWGIVSGLVLLATYVQGYLSTQNPALLGQGLSGLAIYAVMGITGGLVAGLVVVLIYNRLLGSRFGIRLDLDRAD